MRFHRVRLTIVCVLLAAAAVACSTPLSSSPTTSVNTARPVPSVAGLTAQAAGAKLTAAGFTFSATHVFSTTAPTGTVAAQTPSAGTSEPIGTAVAIAVSQGRGAIVPNVHGLAYAVAAHRIKLAGLTSGGVHTYSATVAIGRIVAQGEAAGTRVVLGTHVVLYISKGHAPVAVPNVRGLSLAAAEHALRVAGFTIDLLKAPRHGASCPAGKVYRTFPHAHQLEPYRSPVKVVPCA